MPSAIPLINFHDQHFIIRNRKLAEYKYVSYHGFRIHAHNLVEYPYRIYKSFLYGCTACGFLVANLKTYVIDVESHLRTIPHRHVQIEQIAVYINSAQQNFYAETVTADTFDIPDVPPENRVHDPVDRKGRLPGEFVETYVRLPVRKIRVGIFVQSVLHLDVEPGRIFGIDRRERVEASVGRDDRKVRLFLEALFRGFDAHDVPRPVRLVRDQVETPQIDINRLRGEKDVERFAESDLYPAGLHDLPL